MDKTPKRIVLNHVNGEPLFRIGLFGSQEYIDFKVNGKFAIQDGDGNDLIKRISSDLKWRVKIKDSRPGSEHYVIVLYESFDAAAAENKLLQARKADENATLKVLGGEVILDGRKINNNTKYAVCIGSYPNAISARKDFKRYQPDFIPRVERELLKPGGGNLEVFDAEYDRSADVANVVRIVPDDVNTEVKIYSIRSFDDILQRDHFTDLVYNGTIEFRFDVQGNLMGISEIPLESYMKRVIYSEIGEDLPLEFAKSLAIVCRSEAIARINQRRLGDPFDYTYSGETLRYFGNAFEDKNIEKAVEATHGQVLVTSEGVRDTPFHLISGGHTEDMVDENEDNPKVYFEGRYNGPKVPKGFKGLRKENAAQAWIQSRPDTWCNLRGRELPESLERVKKHFRWEVDYSRRELEDLVRKKTGEDIGILFEIMPHLRGASGRLLELELIGSLKNFRIRGELNIREALSHTYLPSSCFMVERELDETGTPISFTFVGAGQGHGLGMCKTGAAVMAMEKYKCQDILKHFFGAVKVQSIYKLDLS